MAETVWVKTRRIGNSGLAIHTERDCPRITNTHVVERDRSLYPDDTPVCQWCLGEVDLANAGAPNTLSDQLEAMDPDDLGG